MKFSGLPFTIHISQWFNARWHFCIFTFRKICVCEDVNIYEYDSELPMFCFVTFCLPSIWIFWFQQKKKWEIMRIINKYVHYAIMNDGGLATINGQMECVHNKIDLEYLHQIEHNKKGNSREFDHSFFAHHPNIK